MCPTTTTQSSWWDLRDPSTSSLTSSSRELVSLAHSGSIVYDAKFRSDGAVGRAVAFGAAGCEFRS